MLYSVRYLWFNDRHGPVIVQSVNGPCPLLAIANCLLLRGHIALPPHTQHVTFEQLIDILKSYATKKMEQLCLKEKNETLLANALKSFDDSLKLLPNLEHGLDLNVIHAGPSRFEFTPAISLFDLFEVRLVHGWCYDPSDGVTATAIANHSYNELVNILSSDPNDIKGEHKSSSISSPSPSPSSSSSIPGYPEASRQLMRKFLDQTAMQMTDTGLKLMREIVREGELAILFRNNHFACIYRHHGALFSLITDHSLLTAAPSLAWTSLDVRGDEHYFDQMFARPGNGAGMVFPTGALPSPYARAIAPVPSSSLSQSAAYSPMNQPPSARIAGSSQPPLYASYVSPVPSSSSSHAARPMANGHHHGHGHDGRKKKKSRACSDDNGNDDCTIL